MSFKKNLKALLSFQCLSTAILALTVLGLFFSGERSTSAYAVGLYDARD